MDIRIFFAFLFLIVSGSFSVLAKQELELAGPAAVVSYPLMVMAKKQVLSDQDIHLNFQQWQNPDQLRAIILGEQADFSAMPSNLAATFYNRGHELKLLNISIWNIMWLMSSEPNVNSFEDLLGETVVVPFKNDMPNIVFSQLLNTQLGEKAGSVNVRFSHNLMDASQLLLAGQVKHALLIEPLASVAKFRAIKNNRPINRAVNISEVWAESFPDTPKLPQAGIVANTSVSENKALLAKVNQAYKRAASWCKAEAEQCADIVKAYLPKVPKIALIEAINLTDLTVKSASEVKAPIMSFYQLLAKTDKQRIGGKLPDSGLFY